MKILQVISGREINGALTYCKYLSEMLAARGHDVTILCRRNGWLEQTGVKGVRFINCEMNRKPSDVGRIANWMRHEGIDVLHTHMSRAHAFGVLLKMTSGVPVIATAHNRSFQIHWRMNDFVIANSQATMDYQRRVNRVGSSNLEKVLCFTDLQRFKGVTPRDVYRVKRQLKVNPDEFLCGCVGEIIKRKGQVYLFQALRQIIEAIPNFKLVLLGRFRREEPYTQKLRSILLSEGLQGRVKWLGLRENIQDFMTAFDLLAVPSIEEPLGLVAVESLAAGTPVVATRTGGLPEIVKHQRCGLLVPPRNPGALAKSIIELAKNEPARRSMGLAGQEFVYEEFDTERLCERVEQIYEHVVSRRIRCAA
ncbi:glycosyltransferase family 4 protein [Mariniblastus fucicola]|uniref:glycosyltransferase family 4 protein n=1 Tax=Mariniblastus fucicola TaxID=980251 RepID=UPI0011E0585A|nr:glycosyltransferase family 4 protein [Mariniblastus fucicola]